MELQDNRSEAELISKKELLQRYGISYGALYRWKRKGLIPEEWFIKRATVTGQETFFPRELAIERIELILSQKEDSALDEIAKKLNNEDFSNANLTLATVFGEKSFSFKHIKSIFIELGGKRHDISSQISALEKALGQKEN